MNHGQWRHLRRMLGTGLVLSLFACTALHAQSISPPPAAAPPAPAPEQQHSALQPAPPCVGCYTGFAFDTTFRIGAHFNGLWPGAMEYLKDSLHIGITRLYGHPSLRVLFDSAHWGSDPRTIWDHRLNVESWKNMKAADVKVVFEPGDVSDIAKGSEMSEAYFDQAREDTLQQIDFTDHGPRDTTDRQRGSFIIGGVFQKSGTPVSPVKMVGAPQWTAMGIAQTGYYLPSQSSSVGLYDIAVAIKTPIDSLAFINLPTNGLIAYVKVYRRIAVGQDSCGCNLYEYLDSVGTYHDSLPITKTLYLDTLRSDKTIGAPGNPYRDVTFSFRIPEPTLTVTTPLNVVVGTGDTIRALGAGTLAKYVARGGFLDRGTGHQYHGDANGSVRFARYCARLKDSLVARGYYNGARVFDRSEIINSGDFGYEVYTTRKVDLTFLRGRLAPHSYALLRHGAFDATIDTAIYSALNDPTLDSTMNKQLFRFCAIDEHAIEKYRGYMEVVSRMDNAINKRDSHDVRGIFANPQRNGPALRVFSGDLDSTKIKMVHMMANQWYNYGGLTPVTYANPDAMNGSAALTDGLYRAVDDSVTGAKRIIMYNDTTDYRTFTAQTMKSNSERIDQLAQMTNAARFMFRHIRSESYPVYSVVQVHGNLNRNDSGIIYQWNFPIVTPEEITVQSWLTIAMSLDGMWFSDFTFDGSLEFGVMHQINGPDTSNYKDALDLGDPNPPYHGNPNWTFPKMWTGFKDRLAAVRRVTDDFTKNILPVYTKLDRNNGVRMNMWRDADFWAMPLLESFSALRAKQYRDGSGHYQDSITISGTDTVRHYDVPDSTFFVATVFSPRPYDTGQTSRYLTVVNLRCWPVDYQSYTSYVTGLHPGNSSNGFGAIDVRKPVVVLKNSLGIIADSVRVQRIGDSTSRVVAYGKPVELD